jgi:hypothetical protein
MPSKYVGWSNKLTSRIIWDAEFVEISTAAFMVMRFKACVHKEHSYSTSKWWPNWKIGLACKSQDLGASVGMAKSRSSQKWSDFLPWQCLPTCGTAESELLMMIMMFLWQMVQKLSHCRCGIPVKFDGVLEQLLVGIKFRAMWHMFLILGGVWYLAYRALTTFIYANFS